VALAAPALAASALYGGHKENSIRKIKSIKEKAQKFSLSQKERHELPFVKEQKIKDKNCHDQIHCLLPKINR
jgi:hypothetical protein